MRVVQEFFLLGAMRIDLACIVICDPAVALERYLKFNPTKHQGSTTNLDVIKLLLECNFESYEELRGCFPQLVVLDTTDLKQEAMVKRAREIMIQALEKKIHTAY